MEIKEEVKTKKEAEDSDKIEKPTEELKEEKQPTSTPKVEEEQKPTSDSKDPSDKGSVKLEKSDTEKNIEKKKAEKKADAFNVYFSGVSKLTVSLAIRQMGLMLKSGLSLTDALDTLTEQSNDARLSKAFSDILENIESGKNLADSMKEHPKIFSDIVVSIISIGEQAGSLEKNLIFIAEYLKKEYELDRKIKGAMIYPVIVFGLTVVEMTGVIFFILPKLQDLFRTIKEVPPFTKFILDLTFFVRTNIIALIVGTIVFVILSRILLNTKAGKIFKDVLALRAPVFNNLTKHSILTSFARTLAILLETGIPISRALEITAETANNYEYKKVLHEIHLKVKNGKNLADTLEEYPNHFPVTFTKMISVGEKTGTLEVNLFYLYEYHADEVKDMSENLTTLLEPILLIFIGLMIGLLALTIIGPVYQLTGSLNG